MVVAEAVVVNPVVNPVAVDGDVVADGDVAVAISFGAISGVSICYQRWLQSGSLTLWNMNVLIQLRPFTHPV